jgi:hypothetical protein
MAGLVDVDSQPGLGIQQVRHADCLKWSDCSTRNREFVACLPVFNPARPGQVTSVAAAARPLHVAWIGMVISIGLFALLFDQRLKRREAQRDAIAGVLARFRDLAVTQTELLVGAALTGYPLEGIRAWVEIGADGITYLHVEGPTVALLRKVSIRRNEPALSAMRAWAQKVNLQAHGGNPHADGASTLPEPSSGIQ